MKLETSTQSSYRVVVCGMQPGRSRAEFVANLASTWKVDANYVNQVFSSSGLTVKSAVDLATATKLMGDLKNLHCQCQIVDNSTGDVVESAGAEAARTLDRETHASRATLTPEFSSAGRAGLIKSVLFPVVWMAFTVLATFAFVHVGIHQVHVAIQPMIDATGADPIEADDSIAGAMPPAPVPKATTATRIDPVIAPTVRRP